jgi:predicted RNA binding protein YcfA (HicA-like mRNA interferase family)
MSDWPSTRAKLVLAALLRIGWRVERQTGYHKSIVKRQAGPI